MDSACGSDHWGFALSKRLYPHFHPSQRHPCNAQHLQNNWVPYLKISWGGLAFRIGGLNSLSLPPSPPLYTPATRARSARLYRVSLAAPLIRLFCRLEGGWGYLEIRSLRGITLLLFIFSWSTVFNRRSPCKIEGNTNHGVIFGRYLPAHSRKT